MRVKVRCSYETIVEHPSDNIDEVIKDIEENQSCNNMLEIKCTVLNVIKEKNNESR